MKIEIKVDDLQLAESCLSSRNKRGRELQMMRHSFRMPGFCQFFFDGSIFFVR